MTALHEEPLTDENLDEVIQFVRGANPFAQETWGWDLGRFIDFRWGGNNIRADWKSEWFGEHCRVFRSHDDITALAIAEEGADYECILTKQPDPAVVASILDLLIERHRSRHQKIALEFTEGAGWLREVCRAAGLTEATNTGREWEYELATVDTTVAVPEGYEATTLADRPDVDRSSIARCVERAFESTRDLAPMIRFVEKNPWFRPELSVVVLSPEGDVAAYCRGTVDAENGIGGIDPVCTDPDHQGKGLGKAAVRLLMSKQAELGGRYSYIGSAPPPAPGTFLYRSLGPSREFVGCEWTG